MAIRDPKATGPATTPAPAPATPEFESVEWGSSTKMRPVNEQCVAALRQSWSNRVEKDGKIETPAYVRRCATERDAAEFVKDLRAAGQHLANTGLPIGVAIRMRQENGMFEVHFRSRKRRGAKL